MNNNRLFNKDLFFYYSTRMIQLNKYEIDVNNMSIDFRNTVLPKIENPSSRLSRPNDCLIIYITSYALFY